MGNSASSRFKSILNWLPATLAVVMIACESTSTMSAANTSRWLLPLWVHLFGPVTAQKWAVIHHLIRKTGHFTGYGVVSLCFFHGWRSSLSIAHRSVNAVRRSSALLAVMCTLVIASADEFHQSFLPSRTSSPYDVGIDVCGAIVMQIFLLSLLQVFAPTQDARPVAV